MTNIKQKAVDGLWFENSPFKKNGLQLLSISGTFATWIILSLGDLQLLSLYGTSAV